MEPISEITNQLNTGAIRPTQKTGNGSFEATLNGFLAEANRNIMEAGEMAQKFAKGEVTEIHDVMIASEKASVSLEMVVEIRNKMVEAYREMMRIQI